MSRQPDPWDEPEPSAQGPAAPARSADLFAEWDAGLSEPPAADSALAAIEAEYHARRNPPASMPLAVVTFTVPGPPRGKGRARSVPVMRGGKPVIGKGGRPMIVVHADGKSASYESLIRLAAAQALGDREPTEAPIEVEVTAYRLPPSSWLKGVRKLALAGGLSCTGKPDPDNIAKAVLDACNGVVWHDDAQVVGLTVRKRFAPIARLEVAVTLTGIPAPPR